MRHISFKLRPNLHVQRRLFGSFFSVDPFKSGEPKKAEFQQRFQNYNAMHTDKKAFVEYQKMLERMAVGYSKFTEAEQRSIRVQLMKTHSMIINDHGRRTFGKCIEYCIQEKHTDLLDLFSLCDALVIFMLYLDGPERRKIFDAFIRLDVESLNEYHGRFLGSGIRKEDFQEETRVFIAVAITLINNFRLEPRLVTERTIPKFMGFGASLYRDKISDPEEGQVFLEDFGNHVKRFNRLAYEEDDCWIRTAAHYHFDRKKLAESMTGLIPLLRFSLGKMSDPEASAPRLIDIALMKFQRTDPFHVQKIKDFANENNIPFDPKKYQQ